MRMMFRTLPNYTVPGMNHTPPQLRLLMFEINVFIYLLVVNLCNRKSVEQEMKMTQCFQSKVDVFFFL